MSIASQLQAGALSALQILGQPVTCTRSTRSGFNTSTGALSELTQVNYSGYGYPGAYTTQEIDNVNVLSTDIRLTFYTTTAPVIDDVAVIDNTKYRIMSVANISAQGDTIVYRCQLRA